MSFRQIFKVIGQYTFNERERITEAFFRSTAETIEGAEVVARRILVVQDLSALCKLREPSRRWKYDDKANQEDENVQGASGEESGIAEDQCIFRWSQTQFRKNRLDQASRSKETSPGPLVLRSSALSPSKMRNISRG